MIYMTHGKSIKHKIILTTGGIVFDLQHVGADTCGVNYHGELVIIGGDEDWRIHGKVDR